MDEILIGEKKYVSSKRAAKMTGYAKDYIGQLCREGRVPARLVGRSWYVLETAIQDHRFGDQKTEQDTKVEPSTSPTTSTWEAPHYEASSVDLLPSVNRLRHDSDESGVDSSSDDGADDESTVTQRLQDSWRAWFDHVGTSTAEQDVTVAPEHAEKQEQEEFVVEEEEEERGDNDVSIPIHVVYEPPPKELLPSSTKDYPYEQYDQKKTPKEEKRGIRLMERIVKTVVVLSVATLLILAIIGSGYFDKYIVSFRQADIISGATLYNK